MTKRKCKPAPALVAIPAPDSSLPDNNRTAPMETPEGSMKLSAPYHYIHCLDLASLYSGAGRVGKLNLLVSWGGQSRRSLERCG